jgi:ATP-dependent phosphoenolpyruvate carboxykinase
MKRTISTIKRTMAELGIIKPSKIHRNLSYSELLKHETQNKEGVAMKTKYGDTFSVSTGKFTGRSPKDKWIVRTSSSNDVWWGEVNQPTTPEVFEDLLTTAVRHYNTLDSCYVFDGYCGVSSQKKVRFFHEMAWQQHFVKNMFISPSNEDLDSFEPDFTIINACSEVNNEWEKHNLNSEVAIAFNLERKLAVILGTWYGGENKKGMFSLMHYWLPKEGIMTMHCSANVGTNGDTALFFGLSGTGKTTLSADTDRALIGDDEHGWDDDGVFNFEGGCYAKTIDLVEDNEPQIYRAIRTNALLENVSMNSDGTPDYFNTEITQNGRVSYPIDHIENWHVPQKGDHPKNIIFLTCDAFGVLPPVAKLTPEQAVYHFLNGYTAKVAGTERGVTEPTATFSACFGAAFLTLHPSVYAELLKKKIERHGSNVFLVNTGWSGGPYGVGERMNIDTSRACIRSILDGSIHNMQFETDTVFGFDVPVSLPGVPKEVCSPRMSWKNSKEYDLQAEILVNMFDENFKKYH